MNTSFRACVLVLLAAGCGARLAATGEAAITGPNGHLIEPEGSAASPVSVLIREGMTLHDKGDYDGAVAKYREALKAQPGNDVAWHELAYSLFRKKEFPNALDAAEAGVKLNGRAAALLYMMIGNIQDNLGSLDKAVAAYEAGIHEDPKIALLHFNRGVTLLRLKRQDDARRAFQRSILLDPDHASSHFLLGYVYLKSRYRVPALLALARFLVLEPDSQRSDVAVDEIAGIFSGSATADPKNKRNITLTVPPGLPKDEGDFFVEDTSMSILDAITADQRSARNESGRLHLKALIAMLVIGKNNKRASTGFAQEYYVPYFNAMENAKMLENFSYFAFQKFHLTEGEMWLKKHPDAVSELQNWSKQYRWNTAALITDASLPAAQPATPATAPSAPVPAASANSPQ
jgi:tetratricopeptide (TPR) repeat protein